MTPQELLGERGSLLRDFLQRQRQEAEQTIADQATAQGIDPDVVSGTFFEQAIRKNPEQIQEAIRNLARAESTAALARQTAAQQSLDDAIRRDLFQSLGAGFRAGALGETESLERLTQAQFDAQDALRQTTAEARGVATQAQARAALAEAELEEETRVANLEAEQAAQRRNQETFQEAAAKEEARLTQPTLAAIEEERETAKDTRAQLKNEADIELAKARAATERAKQADLARKRKEARISKGDLTGLSLSELVEQSRLNQADLGAFQNALDEDIRLAQREDELSTLLNDPTITPEKKQQIFSQLNEVQARRNQFRNVRDDLLEDTVLRRAQQGRIERAIIEQAADAEPAEVIALANEFVQQGNSSALNDLTPALASALAKLDREQLTQVIVRQERLGNTVMAKAARNMLFRKFGDPRGVATPSGSGPVVTRGNL